MHRTTINLDEAIYRRVKELARRKGKSMARTIEDLLRQLGLFPDAHIVMIGARPVPLTYVLVEGDLLRILKVASGG